MNAILSPTVVLPLTRPRGGATPSRPSPGRAERLVSVCAWCPPETYRPLRENEAYTHGVCDVHRRQLLDEIARGKKTRSASAQS